MSGAPSLRDSDLPKRFLTNILDTDPDYESSPTMPEMTDSDLELAFSINKATRDEYIENVLLDNRRGWYRVFNECMKHPSHSTNNIVSKWRSLNESGTGDLSKVSESLGNMFELWTAVESLTAAINRRNLSIADDTWDLEDKRKARLEWLNSKTIMNEAHDFITALWEYSRTYSELRVAVAQARREELTTR